MSDIISKRIDGLFVMEVNKGNPNGDPDAGGTPRECNGIGLISDKSIKRKIRDILEDHDNPIFINLAQKTGISKKEFDKYHVLESMTRGFNVKSPLEAKNELKKLILKDTMEACGKYVDVRLFGATFLDEQGDKGNKIRFLRSGVVQIGLCYSIAQISIESRTLTRKANTEDNKSDGGGMAPDGIKFINHAVYVGRFSVNPFMAHKTGTTMDDIELFKNTLPFIFTATESTSRPTGSVNMLKIWWMEHDNAVGSFNANRVISSLLPVKKFDPDIPSTSISDYEIPVYSGTGIKIVDLMNGF